MKTMIWRFSGALLFVAVVLVVASCGDAAPTSPTSIPPATQTTESFGGNLTSGAGNYHLIQTVRIGQVTLKLTGISDQSIKIGMEIGVYSVSGCSPVMQNPAAVLGSSLVGVATGVNYLCVFMFDPGTIPADTTVTYAIEVTHY